jgi:glutamate--cysteine ligase
MTSEIDKIEQKVISAWGIFDEWINSKNLPRFIYSSVDIRKSLNKVVPVDVNLYPAGFNNISPDNQEIASHLIDEYIKSNYANIKNILIYPEHHTRNLFYLDSLYSLMQIIEAAGYKVKIALEDLQEIDKSHITHTGKILHRYLLEKTNNQLHIGEFIPDIVISNNDFTSGIPEILQDIIQPIIPNISFGWYQRRKSHNFTNYNNYIAEISNLIGFDPFYLTADFAYLDNIDFKHQESLTLLAQSSDNILQEISSKYKKYNITDTPYLYIKADNGTYGMGMTIIHNIDEIKAINKKIRNKLEIIKEGTLNSNIIIQEGIKTNIHYQGSPAEDMIYLVNNKPYGHIIRYNSSRNNENSLNAKGMVFNPSVSCYQQKNLNNFVAIIASFAAL